MPLGFVFRGLEAFLVNYFLFNFLFKYFMKNNFTFLLVFMI